MTIENTSGPAKKARKPRRFGERYSHPVRASAWAFSTWKKRAERSEMIVRSAHAASRKTISAATKSTGSARMASPKKSSDRCARIRNSHHTVPTATIASPAHINHCAARTAPAFASSSVTKAPGGSRRLWMRRAITHQTTPTETRIRAGNALWKAPAKTSSPSAMSNWRNSTTKAPRATKRLTTKDSVRPARTRRPRRTTASRLSPSPRAPTTPSPVRGRDPSAQIPAAMLTSTQVETPARKRCQAWTPRRSFSNPSSSSHRGLGCRSSVSMTAAVTFASS